MKLPKSTWFAIIFGSMALVGLFLKDHGDGYPYIYRDVVVGSVLMYGSVGIMVIVGIWFNGEEKEYEVKIDFGLVQDSPVRVGMNAAAEIIVE